MYRISNEPCAPPIFQPRESPNRACRRLLYTKFATMRIRYTDMLKSRDKVLTSKNCSFVVQMVRYDGVRHRSLPVPKAHLAVIHVN